MQGFNSKYVRREQIGDYSAHCRAFVADNPVAWVKKNSVYTQLKSRLHYIDGYYKTMQSPVKLFLILILGVVRLHVLVI